MTEWLWSTKMKCKTSTKKINCILCKVTMVQQSLTLQTDQNMTPSCQGSFLSYVFIRTLRKMNFCLFQRNIQCFMKPFNGKLKDGLCLWLCQNSFNGTSKCGISLNKWKLVISKFQIISKKLTHQRYGPTTTLFQVGQEITQWCETLWWL